MNCIQTHRIISVYYCGHQLERIHVENWICDERIIFHLHPVVYTNVYSKFFECIRLSCFKRWTLYDMLTWYDNHKRKNNDNFNRFWIETKNATKLISFIKCSLCVRQLFNAFTGAITWMKSVSSSKSPQFPFILGMIWHFRRLKKIKFNFAKIIKKVQK